MAKVNLTQRVKELEKEIKVLKNDLIHDSLTGLKTSKYFEEETAVYFSAVAGVPEGLRSERRKWFGFRYMSFLFIDIDNYKKINDEFGNEAGDEVLKKVSKAVTGSVREGDTAARWDGGKIIVTLVGATEADAVAKGELIRSRVEELKFKNKKLHITVSIGVASAEPGSTLEKIITRADVALYKAKELGRNRVISESSIRFLA